MKRERKRIFTTLISIILIFTMLIHPSTSFKTEAATKVKLTSLKYTSSWASFDKLNDDELKQYKYGFIAANKDVIRDNFIFFDAAWSAYVTYNLAGKYTALTGRIWTSTDTGKEGVYEVDFYGDGKLLKSYKSINDDYKFRDVSVNVKGVKNLKILAKKTSKKAIDGYIFFSNGLLTKGSSSSSSSGSSTTIVVPASAGTNKNLTSIKPTQSQWVSFPKKIVTQDGKSHKGNIVKWWANLSNAYVTYGLNKKYTQLTGNLVTSKETGAALFKVTFIGDGKVLKTYKNISNKKSAKINVNVKKVKTLVIRAEKTAGDVGIDDGCVFLINGKLGGGELSFNKTSVVLGLHESFVPVAKYKGKKVANDKISWVSSDKSVAKVNSKGKIVAYGQGACVITGTYKKEKRSIIVYGKPGKVTNVRLTNQGSRTISMKWDKMSSISGYRILMYDKYMEEYDELAVIKPNAKTGKIANSVTIKKLSPNTKYRFKIQAYVTVNKKTYNGEESKELVVTTLSDD